MVRALIICAIVLTLLTACSVANKDASMVVKHTIEKTLNQPSEWNGSFIFQNENGGTLIHTNYDGEHNGDGYIMTIDTQGIGFDSQAEIRKENEELFVKYQTLTIGRKPHHKI